MITDFDREGAALAAEASAGAQRAAGQLHNPTDKARNIARRETFIFETTAILPDLISGWC
ncbi:MAG TPA: hypothetical protein VHB99_10265 [Pirellulales bacterium]|nr:hypothetical protein [Pirellulales bacterium]